MCKNNDDKKKTLEHTYETFLKLAQNDTLTFNEKMGFGARYSRNEENIFADILKKIPNLLSQKRLKVLDIGSGCGPLASMLAHLCQKNSHTLYRQDSPEMLQLLPSASNIVNIPGKFPESAPDIMEVVDGGVDIIICYSVFHCGIFNASNVFDFVDKIMLLLNPQGQCIIGDIPNHSKRKRFFSSETGKAFHKEFMSTAMDPVVNYNVVEINSIDESVLFAMVARCHTGGCDAYIVPQAPELFFANRRDDLLVRKP